MSFPHSRGRIIISSLLVWCTLISPLRFVRAAEASTTSLTSPANVLIGEVQWSGSSRSTADEWLELWNVSDVPVPLAGWSLVGASENPIYFSSSHILYPQQTLLVANYSATTTDKTLLTNQVIAVATSSLSLSNDHLLIELRDASGLLRDSAGTGVKPPAGATSPTNTSMIRVASSTSWAWRAATSTFFTGASDLGSPGICDDCVLQTILAPNVLVDTSPSPLPETSEQIQPTEPELIIEDIDPPETTSSESITTTTQAIPSIVEEPPYSYEISSSTTLTVPTTTDETPILKTPTEGISTNVISTSTADLVATSTEINTATGAESVVSSTPPTAASTSVTIPIPATPIMSPAPIASAASSFVPTPIPDPFLNEIMAAPNANEEEWIELMLPFGASPLRYLDWRIEADNKLVFRFTTTTIKALTTQSEYLVTGWKSSRLKNTGALVRLKRTDGSIVEEVRYSTSTKGASWMRNNLSGMWTATNHPTRLASNILEAVLAPSVKTTPSKPTAVKVPTKTTAASSSKLTKQTQHTPTQKDTEDSGGNVKTLAVAAASKKVITTETNESAKKTSFIKTAASKSTIAKPKTTKAATTKKTQTKKSLVMPNSVTHFEQISPEQLSPRVRVRLQGYIGSTVSVFGKQRFVLLAPDGRGLLVKATTQQPSPNLGETIEITGLLFANDEGVQLQMETGDTWKPVAQTTASTPRLVDWSAPGLEDQWSLTKLEGLVTDSRSSGITLESQVGEVTIPIKAVLGYRSQRVKAGDTIEVLGIFDGRNGQWKVQPAKASDIVILKHPEPESKGAATSPSSTKLPWNAIGIAIGSIGAVEGIRRWLEKRKNTLQVKETPATILGA